MKKHSKYDRGEIAKAVLKGLAIGGIVVAVVALPGMASVLNLFNDDKKSFRRVRRSLYRLKEGKFVKMYYKNGQEFIEITEEGKRRLLKYDLDELTIKKPKKWDKLWRLVIFDIPEKRKQARDAVALKLKGLGFYPIQKSTFIYPYECKDEIDFVGEHFFVRKNINYIIAKTVENEDKLKKIFGIK